MSLNASQIKLLSSVSDPNETMVFYAHTVSRLSDMEHVALKETPDITPTDRRAIMPYMEHGTYGLMTPLTLHLGVALKRALVQWVNARTPVIPSNGVNSMGYIPHDVNPFCQIMGFPLADLMTTDVWNEGNVQFESHQSSLVVTGGVYLFGDAHVTSFTFDPTDYGDLPTIIDTLDEIVETETGDDLIGGTSFEEFSDARTFTQRFLMPEQWI